MLPRNHPDRIQDHRLQCWALSRVPIGLSQLLDPITATR